MFVHQKPRKTRQKIISQKKWQTILVLKISEFSIGETRLIKQLNELSLQQNN